MSSEQSDNDTPLEVSVKKSNKIDQPKQVVKARQTRIKKEDKNSSKINELKKKLRKQLKQKLINQAIEEQLQRMPIKLGERQNKIIKMEDIVREKKKIKNIGIQIVQKSRREIRKPQQKYKVQLDVNNRLRGKFSGILVLKKSRK